MTAASPAPPQTEPRAARKRRAILEAAAKVFLRNGYVGTSMDEIAAMAAVSKQTVYKHFVDKERLFTELVTSTLKEASNSVHDEVLHLEDPTNLEADLRGWARRTLAKVMQPPILQLRRLVIGEANRFPSLGRTFYELGPGRTIETLTAVFTQLAARGVLRLDDPSHAAEQFSWLIMSIPLNRAMLLGDGQALAAEDLDRYADTGVRIFLAAYGTPSPGRGNPAAR
jgi:TetR/AcrR family transcriptional regulator, mexJK operon transcriptional repressor